MQVQIEVASYRAEIAQIVEDVFRTMLNLDDIRSCSAEAPTPGSLTVAVQFVGEWNGAVLLRCTEQQALGFTARLMPGVQPNRIDEDVRDSLGELANMVAGNLKSVLPHGVALSMPSVIDGSDYALNICGSKAAYTLGFSSDLGEFWVTLVQMLDKDGRS
ncbi:MAG TPA: chemotaxis protein CheX [Bryobacteraceae bacterium]|jgi:chemotaxis protein CheX